MNNYIYSPIIKGRRGEFKALSGLRSEIKQKIRPIIQISPPDLNPKKRTSDPKKRLDDFLVSYYAVWGDRPSFIDFSLWKYLPLIRGQHPIEYIFDGIDLVGHRAVPVTNLDHDESAVAAVKSIVSRQKTGAAIRLNAGKFYKDLKGSLIAHLAALKIQASDVDLIVDVAAPTNFEPVKDLASALSPFFVSAAEVDTWRSVIFCAGAFPESMGVIKAPSQVVSRYDWQLFHELKKKNLSGIEKFLIFGDYDIIHPKQPEEFNPSFNPAAAIRYTIDDAWYVCKGRGLKVRVSKKKDAPPPPKSPRSLNAGSGQYIGLCKKLVESEYFMGADYSDGDRRIFEMSRLASLTEADLARLPTSQWKPGNPGTWLQIGMSHHFTKVVNDLSSVGGS